MTDPCSTCHKRRAVRGSTLCQRCERLAWHGPVRRFECERCRDTGSVTVGCDIHGCMHTRPCICRHLAEERKTMVEVYGLPWDAT